MKTKQHLACSSAIAVGLAVMGLSAHAQAADAPTLLGEVIIGYTQDGTPILASQSTTELDGEDLQTQGGTGKIDDILRRQPSTFTRVNDGNPGVAVNIRGFEGSGRVSMSIDGVPQNFRFTTHDAQGFAYVDENLLAGIDITRGAQTTTGGTGIAGSANFRTLEVGDLVEEGQGFGGKAGLSFGDNDSYQSAHMAIAQSGQNLDMLFAISGHKADAFKDGDGGVVANSEQDRQSALAKWTYRIDDNQEIKLSAMHYQTEYGANSYAQEVTNDVVTLGYHLRGNSPWLNLNVNVFRGKNEMEYVGALGAFSSALGRVLSTTTTGFNATNVSELKWGSWDVTSVNGIDYSQDKLGGASGNVNPTDGTTRRTSLFSENILSNGKFEVTAGFRYNSYKTEGRSSNGTFIDIDHSSLDPKLTVGYWVTDWMQPYASVTRTTRIPTLQEALLGGSHGGTSNGVFLPNPNLRPEVSQGVELGFKLEKNNLFSDGDRLSGRVNYYEMSVEDYITGVISFTPPPGPPFAATFANVAGTSKTKGVEVDLNYSNKRYDMGLTYSYADNDLPAQINGLGATQKTPEETVSLRLARRFLEDRLTIGGQYNYVSVGSVAPGFKDYGLFDLYASYDMTDNFTLNAKVTNLFDKSYTPWMSTTGNQGRGRSVFLGGNMKF